MASLRDHWRRPPPPGHPATSNRPREVDGLRHTIATVEGRAVVSLLVALGLAATLVPLLLRSADRDLRGGLAGGEEHGGTAAAPPVLVGRPGSTPTGVEQPAKASSPDTGSKASSDAGSYVVRVVDEGGRPVPKALAWLSLPSECGGMSEHGGLRPVINGVGTFENVSCRGTAHVDVWGAKDAEGAGLCLVGVYSREVNLADGHVEVTLRRGTTVTVRVIDESGEPLAGSMVIPQITVGESRHLRSWFLDMAEETNAEGEVTLCGLDPSARYRLIVEPPPSRPDLTQRHTEDWRALSQTVSLTSERLIRGRVVSDDGMSVESARVIWWDDRGNAQTVTTSEAGDFVIAVSERSVRAVAVSADAMAGTAPESAQIISADRANVLVLEDVGATLTVRVQNWDDLGGRLLEGWATPMSGGVGSVRTAVASSADGALVFRLPGRRFRYVIWLSTNDGELGYYKSGVDVSTNVMTVELLITGSVRGRLVVETGISWDAARVEASGEGLSVAGSVDRAGNYEIRGLPRGEKWTVRAVVQSVSGVLVGEGVGQTGGRLDIVCERRQ